MDRLIRIITALVAVAVVAAVISYQHAFELVRSHGEVGLTARLVPFTVDGLIWAASMVVLDVSRRGQPVTRLGARPGRCPGQRLAGTGTGRLIRATDDAHPHRARRAIGPGRARTAEPI